MLFIYVKEQLLYVFCFCWCFQLVHQVYFHHFHHRLQVLYSVLSFYNFQYIHRYRCQYRLLNNYLYNRFCIRMHNFPNMLCCNHLNKCQCSYLCMFLYSLHGIHHCNHSHMQPSMYFHMWYYNLHNLYLRHFLY